MHTFGKGQLVKVVPLPMPFYLRNWGGGGGVVTSSEFDTDAQAFILDGEMTTGCKILSAQLDLLGTRSTCAKLRYVKKKTYAGNICNDLAAIHKVPISNPELVTRKLPKP